MNAKDTLWDKEKLEQKTVQIEDKLYEKLVKISENLLDASVSRLINACIYDFADITEFTMKEVGEMTKHSVIFRKSASEKLMEARARFNLPQYVILNFAIREGIKKILDDK